MRMILRGHIRHSEKGQEEDGDGGVGETHDFNEYGCSDISISLLGRRRGARRNS